MRPVRNGMSEAQARERFRAQDYVLVKHKISSGHCHEFYAVDAQGTVVESYLHPITGEVVRTTRVPNPAATAQQALKALGGLPAGALGCGHHGLHGHLACGRAPHRRSG